MTTLLHYVQTQFTNYQLSYDKDGCSNISFLAGDELNSVEVKIRRLSRRLSRRRTIEIISVEVKIRRLSRRRTISFSFLQLNVPLV